MEQWKTLKECDNNIYQVSDLGNARRFSKLNNKFKAIKTRSSINQNRNAYSLAFTSHNKNKPRTHHLKISVASLFVPNPKNYTNIINIDGDYKNCKASNLKWCNRNTQDLYEGQPTNNYN